MAQPRSRSAPGKTTGVILEKMEKRLQKLDRQQRVLADLMAEVTEQQAEAAERDEAAAEQRASILETLKGLENQVQALVSASPEPSFDSSSGTLKSSFEKLQRDRPQPIDAKARAAVGQQRRPK